MRDTLKSISRLEWGVVVAIGVVFVLDATLPSGVVEWVFYGVPLFLTVGSPRKHLPLVVAVFCSILIGVGFIIVSSSGIPTPFHLVDRSLGAGFLVLCAVLIERHRRLEVALTRSRETLHALLIRLERTREEERTRMARDVHDDLGQSLTALKMDLRWIERKLEKTGTSPELDAVKARTTSAIEVVNDTTAIVQELAAQLRPGVLDRLGLCSAIQFELRRFQARAGIECRASVPASLPALAPDVATALFRILQECLANVARHASATRVLVRLGIRDGIVTLRVLDNGSGIGLAALNSPGSLGLMGMQERATTLGGSVFFRRGNKRGTMVTVRIPHHEP
jgi:signal transduction histidine kinase